LAILDFADGFQCGRKLDFWSLEDRKDQIPNQPGAYILIARGDTRFTYPNGRSPVFYIGQSKNIQARLRQHFYYASQARHQRELHLYWPRYEYAAKFGGRFCFVLTHQGLSPKALEEELLARFAKKYLSFPIANGSGSWNRINRIFAEG
jgi:hypothetical protein